MKKHMPWDTGGIERDHTVKLSSPVAVTLLEFQFQGRFCHTVAPVRWNMMMHEPARFIDASVANAQPLCQNVSRSNLKTGLQMSMEVSSPTWLELWAAVMSCQNVFFTLPRFNLATCLLWRLGLGRLPQFCWFSFIFRTIFFWRPLIAFGPSHCSYILLFRATAKCIKCSCCQVLWFFQNHGELNVWT